jgi:hypothetical protein
MTSLDELVGLAVAPALAAFTLLRHDHVRRGSSELRRAIDAAPVGGLVGYAIPLNTPLSHRLRTMIALRYELWRIAREMERAGARPIGRYGVEPNLDTPAFVFELDTAAAAYADRCFRPRGRALLARRCAARVFGCDPALGALLVIARKS